MLKNSLKDFGKTKREYICNTVNRNVHNTGTVFDPDINIQYEKKLELMALHPRNKTFVLFIVKIKTMESQLYKNQNMNATKKKKCLLFYFVFFNILSVNGDIP